MATILEQVQTQNNPVLDSVYAQTTMLMSMQTPEKMRETSTQTTTHKHIKNKVNTDCNCYENANEDYRSFVRKPEFLM